ncbi:metallophosphoesterase [uncultured Finegoldia sp.]|uniref:metallophosphoesterase n=1 Tax=uncultured Finegoldia sp. TaxID=328009 RepID=UPI002611DE2E|nr:metallophosphoesterase [uncultured Finegoldia sp.]
MIYALGDLHLDYTKAKSMDIFGNNWKNYEEKIFDNLSKLNNDDILLIPGDITWAMQMDEAYIDLKRIDEMPAQKILTRGNHDYWWGGISKLRKLDLKSISFIQNDSIEFTDLNICGSRGWLDPSNKEATEKDAKIFEREILRVKMSLDSVKNDKKIIMMLHYPPFDINKKPNELFKCLKEYNVTDLVYGHLHGYGHINIVEGLIDGINVHCVSSDYINFKAKLIRK